MRDFDHDVACVFGSSVVQMTIDLSSGLRSKRHLKNTGRCSPNSVQETSERNRKVVAVWLSRNSITHERFSVLSAPPTWYRYKNVPCRVRKKQNLDATAPFLSSARGFMQELMPKETGVGRLVHFESTRLQSMIPIM